MRVSIAPRIIAYFAISATVAAVDGAWGATPSDDAPFVHPLNSKRAAEELARLGSRYPGRTTAELLREVETFEEVEFDAYGHRSVRTGIQERTASRGSTTRRYEMPELRPAHVDDDLELALAAALRLDDDVDVWVAAKRDLWVPAPTVADAVDIEIAEGRVHTWGEYRRAQDQARADRVAAGALMVEWLQEQVELGGGTVLASSAGSAVIVVRVSARALHLLIEQPDVGAVGLFHSDEQVRPDAPGYRETVAGLNIDGLELEDLLQTQQFYLDTTTRSQGYNGTDVTLVQIEPRGDEVQNGHDVFDNPFGTTPRHRNCAAPYSTSGTCTVMDFTTGGHGHPSHGASILLGDLTAGQDASFTGTYTVDQRSHSGAARGAEGRSVDVEELHWDAVALALGYDIASAAFSGELDTDCQGDTVTSVRMNNLFENGVAVFKSAGNQQPSPAPATSDCRIGEPGSAIGVLAVGAYMVSPSTGLVRMDGDSSQGGSGIVNEEGYGRKIVGVVAPTNFTGAIDQATTSDYVVGPFVNTSAATPAVAGAAAVYLDFHRNEVGTALLGKPGALYALILLMGDRWGGSTAMTSGYDQIRGAGRLRVRKFDDAGVDAPGGLHRVELCVSQSETVYRNLTDTPLVDAIDYIKGVLWWYDPDHESAPKPILVTDRTPHDRIDFYLEELVGTTWVPVASSVTDDNRQRIFQAPVNNARYRFRIFGRDIDTDSTACGTDSIKVSYAAMYERNTRLDTSRAYYARPEDIP